MVGVMVGVGVLVVGCEGASGGRWGTGGGRWGC